MAEERGTKDGTKVAAQVATSSKPECFIIMPVSDPEGYEAGHFKHVFEDIFVPACDSAGFIALRADQVRETNLIHLDVLQRLLQSPMVLCDLSSRNPNVLFELGLRQAFDKPVVLVQEIGTPRIFDIAPLRYTEYRRARIYHEVLEDQKAIAQAIAATKDAYEKGSGVNSIVKILALTQPATLADVQEASQDPALQIVRAELSELRHEMRRTFQRLSQPSRLSPSEEELLDEFEPLRIVIADLEERLLQMKRDGEVDTEFGERLAGYKDHLIRRVGSSANRITARRLNELAHRIANLEGEYSALTTKVGRSRGDA